MTITEKVAFLRGLIEGSELKFDDKKGKVFELAIDLIDELATAVSDLDEDVSVLYDDVDDLSEAIEDIDHVLYHLSDEDEEDEDFTYEIQCEHCGEKLTVDEDALLSDDLVCPACGEPIEFEFDCDCDACTAEHADGKEE